LGIATFSRAHVARACMRRPRDARLRYGTAMLVALRFLRNLLRIALSPLWLLGRVLGRPRERWIEVRLHPTLAEVARPQPWWQHLLARRGGAIAQLRSIAELRRLVRVAASDPNVDGVLLHVPHLRAGWATCTSARAAIAKLRASGKRVVAYLPLGGGNRELYLALAADRILSTPQAPIALLGVGSRTTYYKPLLDRLGVQAEVHAHGEYKTASEPATRDSMSEAQREQLVALMSAIQSELETALATRPGFDATRAHALFEQGLWGAAPALAAGVIDGCCYEDELPRELGIAGDKRKRPLSAARYLAWHEQRLWQRLRPRPTIAVVPVQGAIAPGGPAMPGSRMTALGPTVAALRAARRNRRVRAVLLYVDSPGGSALASDLIHRELVRLREKKPVVAYFGDVAASGGYYVGAPCQRIVAQPTTITGSIGVVSMRPVVTELAERIGLRPQALAAAPHADMLSPFRRFDAREEEMFAAELDAVYRGFVSVVASGRGRSVEDVERVARGRVWSGADALRLGLVDELGGFDHAVDALRALSPELRDLSENQVELRLLAATPQPQPPAEPAATFATALGSALLGGDTSEFGEALSLFSGGERAFLYAFIPELS
jgi:protease-4